jgi:hypothetical protein
MPDDISPDRVIAIATAARVPLAPIDAERIARAASGHIAAAPPNSVMKSHRFIRSPRRHAPALQWECRGPVLFSGQCSRRDSSPKHCKSNSCVVAGRAVEDGGGRTEKDEGVADLMTTPWVTGRARGMGRVWAASCFPNAPGAHSFRGRGARPSSPYQTGNARKGLRPCRASLYGIADLVFWIKARVVS